MAISPPVGMKKPESDGVLDPILPVAFDKVWTSHWWNFRMSRTELTTVASQPFVSCPKDFEQAIHLAREGATGNKIDVVSPSRFYDDHPYPEGDATGLPTVATLLHSKDWDDGIDEDHPYRLYLWPMPAEAHTLPLLYLINSGLDDLERLPGYFVDAVIDTAKEKIGYLSKADAEASLELARERAGGFVMPPGRHKLEGITDLNDFGGRGRGHNPEYGHY